MNQTSQNSEIQIRLPGSGGLCTFPLDSSTRFSDVFRALIGKGCFACPQGKRLFGFCCAVTRIWSPGFLMKHLL